MCTYHVSGFCGFSLYKQLVPFLNSDFLWLVKQKSVVKCADANGRGLDDGGGGLGEGVC